MKSKPDKYRDPEDWEPDWVNPANDRKTPYTEEELDLFVEGFIDSMSDTEALKTKLAEDAIDEVKRVLKELFRQLDQNNLINLDPEGHHNLPENRVPTYLRSTHAGRSKQGDNHSVQNENQDVTIDADKLLSEIEEELNQVSDLRVVQHIRSLIVTPVVVMRPWDYGEPDTEYPCWSVLKHEESNTGIAYSEFGFGPSCPWGLVALDGPTDSMSMGMDSGWFPCFVEEYFDSFASTDLSIWQVFRSGDIPYPGEPVSDESDWDSTWEEVYRLRDEDKNHQYNCHHSVSYLHPHK